MYFQSPGRAEQPREDVSITDDTSSTGNKDDDDDEEEEDVNDENFDGLSRDPERLKAFNVSRYTFHMFTVHHNLILKIQMEYGIH